jgi:hypothetical protein
MVSSTMRYSNRFLSPLLAATTFLGTTRLAAQDTNVHLPVRVIEQRLSTDTFRILKIEGSRRPNDRTQRVTLAFLDSSVIIAKWAIFAPGGEVFNNSPRYEIAAYEFQKMFLDEPDYVVPPTLSRAFDVDWYRQLNADVRPTFGGTKSVLVTLQYWLGAVDNDSVFDLKRFERDTAYARHLANLNVFTHLVKHNDANVGNVLISTNAINPRMFAVDNGLAFGLEESDRGTDWRDLRVPRVPQKTIDRLRTITREDLERTLGVLAEYDIRDGVFVAAEKTENSSRGRGVRKNDEKLQLGLTRTDIDGVAQRIRNLLRRVDSGRLKTF